MYVVFIQFPKNFVIYFQSFYTYLRISLFIFVLDHSFREKVLTWLAEEWSTHLDSLSFTVYNDEGFLFDNKFTFPNLEHLCIGQSRKNTYSFLNSFDHALEMHGCQV